MDSLKLEMKGVVLVVSLEEITPEIAAEILKKNPNPKNKPTNRTLSIGHVDEIAESIKRGEWVVNGGTIVFDKLGDLADGQHRLRSIVKADRPVISLIVRGVDPVAAQDTIDRGRKRTLSQALHIAGEKNATQLAAAISLVYQVESTGEYGTGHRFPSIPRGKSLLLRHPEIRDSIAVGRVANSRDIRYPPGMATGLHYLFSTVDREDADDFWERASIGNDLEIGNPIFALRKILLDDALSRQRRKGSLAEKYRAALTIKAWLRWRAGIDTKILRWQPGGSKKEPFPQYNQDPSNV